ncbi:hypothetical protein BCR36DRAFT_415776 [Piromyces finnis]|uniref:Type 1 phosphatases regulator n=1 Tax=Piromyces finnis TaxID=1754191 RepID=A0A1Y1UXU5_9FUNG|nr:hypothetical protein BCR36DRAFT_415776 [Piromyces finnis]|eukprot:ORX43152.1 hypothetical protein BCR36DRAFT_415776 [Piromyces finnis]
MEEENNIQNQIATETIIIEQSTSTNNQITGTLILHGENENERHVRWTNETIDNENMGKKKSKICCIYFKPRNFDDSSSESSSSSDDDNKPNAYERQPKYKKKV